MKWGFRFLSRAVYLGSLHSEGGIDQDSVVFIGVDQRVDHIGWGFELGVVVVRSVLHGTHHGPHISLSHFDRVVGVEAGHVVVHFWAVLVSESDEFENLGGYHRFISGGEVNITIFF